MPICQRVYQPEFGDYFAVTNCTDESLVAETGGRLCGKPAFYKQVSTDGKVAIWICNDCYNEFEAANGEGSWKSVEEFPEE